MAKPGNDFSTNAIMGYKITKEQKKAIENQLIDTAQYFNPAQDINGDWFIFEQEIEYCVKNKGWARATLAEYVPPAPEPIPGIDF